MLEALPSNFLMPQAINDAFGCVTETATQSCLATAILAVHCTCSRHLACARRRRSRTLATSRSSTGCLLCDFINNTAYLARCSRRRYAYSAAQYLYVCPGMAGIGSQIIIDISTRCQILSGCGGETAVAAVVQKSAEAGLWIQNEAGFPQAVCVHLENRLLRGPTQTKISLPVRNGAVPR
eukprot:2081734-Rhodomonas_salina.1